MYHNFFIHSSVDEHLGCFRILAIVSSAAMNIGVQVPFWIIIFSGYMPSSGISGSYYCCYCCCSGTKSCLTLWNPMNHTTWGFLVLHYVSELAHTHVPWVGDAIQPSHLLLPPFSSCLQSFRASGSSHQFAKVLEVQLQHQSFQWKFSIDFF